MHIVQRNFGVFCSTVKLMHTGIWRKKNSKYWVHVQGGEIFLQAYFWGVRFC